MRRTLLLLTLLAPVLAQDEPPARGDVDRANEARARYLATRPYHDKVFDDLVVAARAQGSLGAWVARVRGDRGLEHRHTLHGCPVATRELEAALGEHHVPRVAPRGVREQLQEGRKLRGHAHDPAGNLPGPRRRPAPCDD